MSHCVRREAIAERGAAVLECRDMAVVRSKLRPPPLRPGTLPRRALEAALDGAAAEVVILVGPAGQGKTTALAQRAAHERAAGRATGWLTLDEADNDRRQLEEQLGALIAGLGGGALRSDDLGAWLADQLERVESPLSLYFDDFHLLEAPELLAAFRRFLLALPDGVRVYVAARALPELGLSRLALRGALRVLDAADLCFSPGEVAELCADAELSKSELAALHERTGGWPAALQLFRMALSSPRVRASLADPRGPQLRELSAYLSENVLALQAPELRAFLLDTAPLEVLSVALARRVTGRDDADALLGRLERAGFFVRAADAEAGSFRYHPMLAQLIAEQLAARSPSALARVHALAAQHYLGAGDHAGVLRHALACGDFPCAAQALDAWASALVASGRLSTVERWLAQIPFEHVAARPALCIKASYAFVFLRRQAELSALCAVLEHCPRGALTDTRDPSVVLAMVDVCVRDEPPDEALVDPALDDTRPPSAYGEFAAFELSAKHNLLAYRALSLGDFQGGHEHVAAARAYGGQAAAPFSGAYTDTLESAALLLAGDLRAALAEQRAALARRAVDDEDASAAAPLLASHVWALYEAGELEAAVALFTRHRQGIARATTPDLLVVSYAAAARAHASLGHPAEERAMRNEARAIARADGWRRAGVLLAWEDVRRALLRGELAEAEALAARAGEPEPGGPRLRLAEHFAGARLVRAQLHLARGQLAQAESVLVEEQTRVPHGAYRELQCALLQAELALVRGAPGSARLRLRRALRIAAEGGFTRAVRELSAPLAALRDEILGAGDEPGAAELLESPRLASAGSLPEHGLSARELEVLQQLALGTSNRDIARAMFVSENTVKFHLKSVYAKLQVEGRVQAVRAAQRLGVVRG